MKAKKKRGIEVPPKIQSFVGSVTSLPLESIEAPLTKFSWEYDKGDFYHWVELMNHFDSYYEKHIRPRKDVQLEGEFNEANPFPREAVLQILRVTRIILENCINKHCYSSYEHLSTLLASTDTEVVISSLQTLAAFVKKPVQSNRAVRWHGDHTLNSRLFSLSQGWGVKEEGLGLVACALEDGCDLNAVRLASVLHFEFYLDASPRLDTEGSDPKVLGLKTIHKQDLQDERRNDLDILQELVNEYKVPVSLRFSLLTRLRFARSFSSLHTRRQYLSIRLLAFTILLQSNPDAEDLTAFFSNEPEFVNELVTLLHCEDSVPENIRLLAVFALAAQAQDRPRQSSVLSAISAGGNRGILPTLVQNAVGFLRGLTFNCSISFVEALLYLVTVLVSTSAGCAALRECGLIPTLLPFLKDTNPLHTHLVASGVHILEAFMDYSNPSATLFRDLGGLDDAITRLKFEIDCVEEKASKQQQEAVRLEKGKMPVCDDMEGQQGPVLHPETIVSFQSRLLLKVLLRAISLGTYAPGNAGRVHGSEENALASSLCTIFRLAKEFGGGVFALAASLMSDLIHKDPTSFSTLDSAGLPKAFLDTISNGVLPSSEAMSCIPHTLDALCLNTTGLATVKEHNALGCFVKIFTSKSYLRALSNETPSLIASGLDELMRHVPTLRADGVDACIAILNTIAVIGGASDATSQEEHEANAPVPMESDTDGTQQRPEATTSETLNAEAYVLEYVHNSARLLEPLLQNADTSRIFVEKKGVEAFLKLYSLPNLPVSFGGSTVAHSMSSAFRAFSPTHAASLSRAVCGALRESLTSSLETLSLLAGAKLSELDNLEKSKIIRCLSSTELYLSLAAVLVRSTNTMMTELNAGVGDILYDVGKVYQEVLWQVSLLDDAKVESKREDSGSAPAITHGSGGREGEEDLGVFPTVQYVNPVSIRDAPSSHWDAEPEIFPLMSGGDGFHRRTRREQGSVSDLFSQRLRRLSRHAPTQSAQVDMEATANTGEGSLSLEVVKGKSPESVNYEVLTRLVSAARGLCVALGKSMVVPSRRRDDIVAPGSAAKAVAANITKLLYDSLKFHSRYSSLPSELSRCRYLQKLVDDILLILFDSRRHACNMLLLNNFYAHDVLGCLLDTFHEISQLLWTVLQAPDVSIEGGNEGSINKKACVLETLQTFAKLLEHLVTPSLLLSPHPMAQMLVQQVANATVGLPRDPEAFVQRLQSRVLEAILPVWNHPLFAKCSVSFISGVASILTHIYSGINDTNDHRNAGNRVLGPPPDESSISMIVEMGFSRERAEEALRRVVTNSVEMAMEWLFSHPEEPQEDDELARALALSLGSSDAPADTENEAGTEKDIPQEEDTAKAPPVEDMLCTCFTLVQSADAVVFPLTDLLVTICNRNDGQDRVRVVTCLIYHLKSCPKDDLDSDASLLSVVSHVLAVVLNEDATAREIAAEQSLVSIILDVLSSFNPQIVLETSVAAPKWTTALLLILDLFLQYKQKTSQDQQEPVATVAASGSGSPSNEKPRMSGLDNEDPFTNVLGKFKGFMTHEEQHRAMTIACNFLNAHIPATSVQAVLQLCARLTKTHSVSLQFLDSGGLTAILSLPRRSLFPGFDSVAAVIIRHLLEDPQTLQQAMELEIRHTFTATPQRHGPMTPRMFLTALAPVVLRNPATFMLASSSVCKIENVGGQSHIILAKERERERDREKERDKDDKEKGKASLVDGNLKAHDMASKPSKGHHKKVPQSFAQVIDQLLEVVLHSPGPVSSRVMEGEGASSADKGKTKCDEYDVPGQGSLSERSAGLAKVAFILKLMMEILLMYSGAVGVVLRRDSESSQGRVAGQEPSGHGGLLYHILHNLLPSTAERVTEKLTEDEWREKLSVKAAYFLLAVCIRSAEGRRRLVYEISRALSASANSSKKRQPPSRKAKAFVFLINIILSAHASSNAQAPGFSADMAKTMIDAGLVQALTSTLQLIDLDHPEAVKFVNAVLRALEALTRAAATSEQQYTNAEKAVVTERLPVQGHEAEEQPLDGTQQGGIPNINNPDGSETQMNEPMVGENHTVSDVIMDSDPPIRAVTTDGVRSESETEVFIRDSDVNLSGRGVTEAADISFRIEHRPENGQDDDDEEMDADDGEEEEEDEDEDEMEGTEDVTRLSPPDTDVDDQDDHGLGDEYGDDIVEEEEEDDWQEDQVIEVRWRDGLTRLNHVQVLGHGGSASLVDFPGDPFQSMNEIFSSFRRSTAVERRRPAGGYRPLSERPGGERGGGAFQHPLLTRLPVSVSTGLGSNSGWTAAGSMTSADALLGVGGYDISPFYMHDHILSTSTGNRLFGERSVGGLLPPLLDFSMDAGYMMGRRGARAESRLSTWTDDGQPQAGAYAASIAQCIEEQYISYLRSLIPVVTEQVDNAPTAQDTRSMEGVEFDTVNRMTQTSPEAAALSSANTGTQTEAQLNSMEDVPMPPLEDQSVACNIESQDERTAVVCRDAEVVSLDATAGGNLQRVDVQVGNAFDLGNRDGPSNQEPNTAVETAQTDMEVDVSRVVESSNREVQDGPEQRCAEQAEETLASAGSPCTQNNAGLNGTLEEGARQAEDAPRNEGSQEMNTIDPTFLEALPDYLRAEVLASHETQSAGAATVLPPPVPSEDIDPEFLAALPPDIQAEVLLQQRNQRSMQTQQAEGQPVEMDSASIIATFPADLREEVLLTSTEQVLAALPPSLLAEAQLLRERAMNQYQASGLFGGGNRFGIRRHNPAVGLDRAVGSTGGLSMGRRAGVLGDAGVKIREVEGKPLVDSDGLNSLVQLLYLAQPLGKGLLQRLLLNLCAHGLTRVHLVKLLLDLLRPGAESSSIDYGMSRLYGCRWNVVYARSQVCDEVPPLVSRRVLEILTYLSKHLGANASLLTYLPPPANNLGNEEKEKGKAKLIDYSGATASSSEGEIPLITLLKLLNQPLYSRSSAHLDQLMVLLEVVTNHLSIKFQLLNPAKRGEMTNKALEGNPLNSDVPETSRQDANLEESQINMDRSTSNAEHSGQGDDQLFQGSDPSTSGAEQISYLSETLSNLPEPELRKLCSLLAQQGLSDSAYSRVAEVLKKLADVAPARRWLFKEELENAARILCGPAISELDSLSNSEAKVLSPNSLGGAAILRVLQCLSNLTEGWNTENKADASEQRMSSTVWDLNRDLEPLWQGLSSCVANIEGCLGNTGAYSSAATVPTGGNNTGVAPPLPPETQKVLPFVEAFFVLSEKLRASSLQSVHPEPGIATAREIKEASSSLLSAIKKTEGDMSFLRFAEKHRRMLNAFVRQNSSLLEKSFSVLLKTPRLIDFDNKRAYFRSRIKQQQDHQPRHPLRICVRRPYVLEDSYNQLRMRTIEELKGRLTVQFQGEEGIDAGGLTREWYQLLSRVIFDKGALLFTTVGNESTFQPNPNSVYQTEHLSYFKFVGRVVAKAVFDGQLLDVYFTRSFYKHILGVKVTYHDIEAVDPDYYKNLKWMLENDISDVVGVFFSVDADEEKHILYEKTEVTDVELVPGGRNVRVTEENKHEYVDLNAEHKLTTAIRPQINAFLEGFNELVNRDLISIFNDKELELLISGLPEIDLDDLKANTEYSGYTAASPVVQWFWEVVQDFSKEDMARLLQFITGTSKVPLEGFRALHGISGPQRCQVHKAYGAPERLPTAHTCFNQLDLPEYSSKQQLQERLLLAIHEGSEGFGFG